MATEKIIPTAQELKAVAMSNDDINDLIRQAQHSAAVDRELPVFQALEKYKKAVFWAMFLSTSLIMEGFDVVTVCFHFESRVVLVEGRQTDLCDRHR